MMPSYGMFASFIWPQNTLSCEASSGASVPTGPLREMVPSPKWFLVHLPTSRLFLKKVGTQDSKNIYSGH